MSMRGGMRAPAKPRRQLLQSVPTVQTNDFGLTITWDNAVTPRYGLPADRCVTGTGGWRNFCDGCSVAAPARQKKYCVLFQDTDPQYGITCGCGMYFIHQYVPPQTTFDGPFYCYYDTGLVRTVCNQIYEPSGLTLPNQCSAATNVGRGCRPLTEVCGNLYTTTCNGVKNYILTPPASSGIWYGCTLGSGNVLSCTVGSPPQSGSSCCPASAQGGGWVGGQAGRQAGRQAVA